MKFYKFLFEGDYHAKADGSHEVKVIQRGLDGIEWAYGYGIEVPEYAEEVDGIEGWEAPVPTIPTSIAKWQAKLLLLDMGILSNVEALIAQNPSHFIIWADVATFEIDDLLIQDMTAALGLTTEQLQTMFVVASKYTTAMSQEERQQLLISEGLVLT